MSAHAETAASRFVVRKLHPALGAEVRGVDMRRPLDPAAFRELHDIWMEHLVLVFPDQHVTDAEHVAFTRFFGEPEIFHQKIIVFADRIPKVIRDPFPLVPREICVRENRIALHKSKLFDQRFSRSPPIVPEIGDCHVLASPCFTPSI